MSILILKGEIGEEFSEIFTETVVYIIIYMAIMLLISNIFLFLYSRKLTARNRALVKKATDIPPPPPPKKKKKRKKSPPPPEPAQAAPPPETDPLDELDKAYNHALEQIEQRMAFLGIDDRTISHDTTAEEMACIMRYMFIENEKQALTFSNDSELLWETLQPSLDRMAQSIQSRRALSDDAEDTDLENAINPAPAAPNRDLNDAPLEEQKSSFDEERQGLEMELQQAKEEIKAEQTAQQKLLDELNQSKRDYESIKLQLNQLKFKWHDSKGVFVKLYNQLFDRIKTDPYRAEIAYNLDLMHNTAADLGTVIMGDPQQTMDSSALLDKEASTSKQKLDGPSQGPSRREPAPKVILHKPQKSKPISEKDVKTLKSVVVKQRDMIKHLETRIQQLETVEEKLEFLKEYESQVAQLENLLTESNTCIDLLENEVTGANKRIGTLEGDLEKSLNMLVEVQIGKPLEHLHVTVEDKPPTAPNPDEVLSFEEIEAANPPPEESELQLEESSVQETEPDSKPEPEPEPESETEPEAVETDLNEPTEQEEPEIPGSQEIEELFSEVESATPSDISPENISTENSTIDDTNTPNAEDAESVNETTQEDEISNNEKLNEPSAEIPDDKPVEVPSQATATAEAAREEQDIDALPSSPESASEDIDDLIDAISSVEEEMGLEALSTSTENEKATDAHKKPSSSLEGFDDPDADIDELLSKI